MKKLIVLIIVAGCIAGLWFWAKSAGSVFESDGKLVSVTSGRIEVPVTASCDARERQLVKIKAEASGPITKIYVDEGDVVQPGDLLLEIDEDEENRNLQQAVAAVEQAQAQLDQAKLNYDQAVEDEPYNIERAELTLETAQSIFNYWEFERQRTKELYESEEELASAKEYQLVQREYHRGKSDSRTAELEVKRAKTAGPRSVARTLKQISEAQARLDQANYRKDDVQRRLNKTKVTNSYKNACRVVRVLISEGEIAVGAQTTVGSTTLIELADLTEREAIARVDETDIDKIVTMFQSGRQERQVDTPSPSVDWREAGGLRFGDEVKVEFDALPREFFFGQIVEIAEKPISVSQIITYDVRIRLESDDHLESVRLGMQGNVEFAPTFEEGLLAPYEAVHKMGREQYVVKMPNPKNPMGKPIDREVRVGLTDGEHVVIREGLSEPEQFYVELPTRIGRDDD